MPPQIYPYPGQYTVLPSYTQGVYTQMRPNNMRYIAAWEMPRINQATQGDVNQPILGNNDTDFLDDTKLVLLAIELGVTNRNDLPDLSVIIKDLVWSAVLIPVYWSCSKTKNTLTMTSLTRLVWHGIMTWTSENSDGHMDTFGEWMTWVNGHLDVIMHGWMDTLTWLCKVCECKKRNDSVQNARTWHKRCK